MSRIKFRAWDKEENEFINIKSFGFFEDGEVWYVQAIDEFEREIEPPYFTGENELVTMQCTGLKDKNDKEIYEGDIIKGKYWLSGKYYRFIGEIEYVGSGFRAKGVKQYKGIASEFNPTFEVIGNVYENPELL